MSNNNTMLTRGVARQLRPRPHYAGFRHFGSCYSFQSVQRWREKEVGRRSGKRRGTPNLSRAQLGPYHVDAQECIQAFLPLCCVFNLSGVVGRGPQRNFSLQTKLNNLKLLPFKHTTISPKLSFAFSFPFQLLPRVPALNLNNILSAIAFLVKSVGIAML